MSRRITARQRESSVLCLRLLCNTLIINPFIQSYYAASLEYLLLCSSWIFRSKDKIALRCTKKKKQLIFTMLRCNS